MSLCVLVGRGALSVLTLSWIIVDWILHKVAYLPGTLYSLFSWNVTSH